MKASLSCFGFLLLPVALTACGQAKRVMPPPDCSIEDRYEFQVAPDYNAVANWFVAGDASLQPDGGMATSIVESGAIDPPLCGHDSALVFKTAGNHDWGSLIGTWPPPDQLSPADMDATGYEGLSFWARGVYDKTVSINLDDASSNDSAGQCVPSSTDAGEINPAFYADNSLPVADGCYLSFSAQLIPTEWWSFYTIPFDHFTQGGNTPDPRLQPDGIDRSTISRMVIRAPKGAFVEDWFANFAWYRKKN